MSTVRVFGWNSVCAGRTYYQQPFSRGHGGWLDRSPDILRPSELNILILGFGKEVYIRP